MNQVSISISKNNYTIHRSDVLSFEQREEGCCGTVIEESWRSSPVSNCKFFDARGRVRYDKDIRKE